MSTKTLSNKVNYNFQAYKCNTHTQEHKENCEKLTKKAFFLYQAYEIIQKHRKSCFKEGK